MRLWHKDLVSVLPRKQLLAQWRECCCIASNIAEDGTLNHILVNYILDYDYKHFVKYTKLIYDEMQRRGYKISQSSFENYKKNMSVAKEYFNEEDDTYFLFENHHNIRYLNQCYFNLQEKYDRGMFDKEEFDTLTKRYFELKYSGKRK